MSVLLAKALLDAGVVVMMALHIIDVIAESDFDRRFDRISALGIAIAYSWAIYRISTLWVPA